jgi:hypothetical protein
MRLGAQEIMQAWCFQNMSTKLCLKLTLFSALLPALLAAAAPVGSIAPDFSIKDQYDHELRLSSQRGKPVLLIYGDRLGNEYMGAYGTAVTDSNFASSVNVIRIANLHAVPSLMRSWVKRQFVTPTAEGKPRSVVLLDWDAELGKIYGFTEDLTNVYLIDQNGVLRYSACGQGTSEDTRRLLEMIAKTIEHK